MLQYQIGLRGNVIKFAHFSIYRLAKKYAF